ncbi:hypothetical protein [Cetobacterium sp.]|uniref:hypothetical protein n=1 Tax=Cetobacterium sp. TaxID=2071632 RepID=UPI003F2A9595
MKKIISILVLCLSSFSFSYDQSDSLYSGDIEYFDDNEVESDEIYTLKIRGEVYNYIYPTINKDGTRYLPMLEFFKSIGFKNYKIENEKIIMHFGSNLNKKEIDLKKLSKDDYLLQDDEYYLSENIFKKYFVDEMRIDKENLVLNIIPNFITPNEVGLMLNSTEKRLKENDDRPNLIYTSEKKLIDTGNLRVNLEGSLNNHTQRGDFKQKDWDGFLEYQSPLLYGEFYTEYDLKDKKFGDFRLTYNDILPNYELEVGYYGRDREKGLSFKKNLGYYDLDGKNFIINEKVALGSRVELLFNGIPIEVQNEENGEVIFANNLIKNGRKFILKIYLPDGKIEEKEIKINEDFNQQNKGEFGYDIYIREVDESHKVDRDLNIYYGWSENLTLGLGYVQLSERFNDRYIYSQELKSELIYSDTAFSNPYTLTYKVQKALNRHKNEEIDYEDRYSQQFMFDADIKKWSINYEQVENGRYYDLKREQYLDLEYELNDVITLTYEREDLLNRKTKKSQNDYSYGVELNNSWKSLLVTYNLDHNKNGDLEHGLDFYYTGFDYFITKWTNKVDKDGNYETELKLTNKTWSDNLDYSIGAKYSSKYEDIYTFDFTLKLDNWFKMGTTLEKNGRKNTFVGIDRVVSLRNPTVNMNTLDSSTLKIVAFSDNNNNNIIDYGEDKLEGIEINLGSNTVITNSEGIAHLYGVPSYTEYELESKSIRPSLKADANRIKVKGTGTSNILVMLPIKPMISLTGFIDTENYSKDSDVLNSLKIRIQDKKNNFNKVLYPEYDGFFYLSDITPGEYEIAITYAGENEDVLVYKENINLVYTNENRGENEKEFKLSRKGVKNEKNN